jgi:Domain of unknown function (DUF6268)
MAEAEYSADSGWNASSPACLFANAEGPAMATQIIRFLAVLLIAWVPAVELVHAQSPESPEPTNPVDAFLRPVRYDRHADERHVEDPVLSPDPRADLPYMPEWLRPRAEATQLLNFGERGLGVTELEAKVGFDVPFLHEEAPLKITPGVAWRWFEGPTAPAPLTRPDMPPWVADFYVDFNWRPRPAKWLFIDLKLTPGFYSDLSNTNNAFRLRGHGMAIIALSEKFQILLGAAYVNRYNYMVVPIGGIRWLPDEDTEIRLLCPAPRISRRIATCGDAQIKVYLAGEYGGGFWAVRRENGQDDSMDYSDYRLLSGIEADLPGDRHLFAEIGYIFSRRIDYVSVNPTTFRPTDTILFRVGFHY